MLLRDGFNCARSMNEEYDPLLEEDENSPGDFSEYGSVRQEIPRSALDRDGNKDPSSASLDTKPPPSNAVSDNATDDAETTAIEKVNTLLKYLYF